MKTSLNKILSNFHSSNCLLTVVMVFIIGLQYELKGQNISINDNGAAPDNSAMLDVSAIDKGILVPRMTAAQRLAIPSPANGLVVFQTDVPRGFYAYFTAHTAWSRLALDSTLNLERVLIGGNDAANNSMININQIGIGTNTPISGLHLVNNIGASANNGAFFDLQNNSGLGGSLSGIRFKNNSNNLNERFHAAIFHRWRNPSVIREINFAIRDNSTTAIVDTNDIKMTINHLGRVGIGTTNPRGMLDLESSMGDANLLIEADSENNDENDNPSIRLMQDGGAISGSIGFEGNPGTLFTNSLINGMYVGTNSLSPLQLLTNNLPRLTLANNGNVGIGLTNPGANLHLSGSNLVDQIVESSNTSGTWFVLRNSSTGGQYHQIISTGSTNGEGVGKMLFGFGNAAGTVNGITMTLEDRSVGIGISNPATRFHLNHASAGPGTGLSLSNQSGGTDRWHFYVFTTDQLALYFNDAQRGSFNQTSGAYSAISDVRFKKNIQAVKGSFLNRLKNIEVKEYHFISQNESESKSIGFIAQELKREFPSLVSKQKAEDSKEEDIHLVNYSGLSVVAIKAIQEQQEIIDQLLEKMNQLEQEINQLKSEK